MLILCGFKARPKISFTFACNASLSFRLAVRSDTTANERVEEERQLIKQLHKATNKTPEFYIVAIVMILD